MKKNESNNSKKTLTADRNHTLQQKKIRNYKVASLKKIVLQKRNTKQQFNQDLNEKNQKLENQLEKKDQALQQLEKTNQELEQQKTKHKNEIEKLQQQLQQQLKNQQQLEKTSQELEQQKTKHKNEVEELEQQLKEKEEENEKTIKELKNQLQQENQALQQQLEQQQKDFNETNQELNETNQALQQQLEQQKIKHKNEIEELENQLEQKDKSNKSEKILSKYHNYTLEQNKIRNYTLVQTNNIALQKRDTKQQFNNQDLNKKNQNLQQQLEQKDQALQQQLQQQQDEKQKTQKGEKSSALSNFKILQHNHVRTNDTDEMKKDKSNKSKKVLDINYNDILEQKKIRNYEVESLKKIVSQECNIEQQLQQENQELKNQQQLEQQNEDLKKQIQDLQQQLQQQNEDLKNQKTQLEQQEFTILNHHQNTINNNQQYDPDLGHKSSVLKRQREGQESVGENFELESIQHSNKVSENMEFSSERNLYSEKRSSKNSDFINKLKNMFHSLPLQIENNTTGKNIAKSWCVDKYKSSSVRNENDQVVIAPILENINRSNINISLIKTLIMCAQYNICQDLSRDFIHTAQELSQNKSRLRCLSDFDHTTIIQKTQNNMLNNKKYKESFNGVFNQKSKNIDYKNRNGALLSEITSKNGKIVARITKERINGVYKVTSCEFTKKAIGREITLKFPYQNEGVEEFVTIHKDYQGNVMFHDTSSSNNHGANPIKSEYAQDLQQKHKDSVNALLETENKLVFSTRVLQEISKDNSRDNSITC